jgi:hypothetical protein
VTPLVRARLACGCEVTVRDPEAPGQPYTVTLDRKAETCTMPIHVGGMPLYDHHAARRPATRLNEPAQPDYEDG